MANVILSKLATDNINEILANVYEFTGFISNPHFHLKSVAWILMHEWFYLGARFTDFLVACILMHEWFNLGAE